MKYTIIAIGAGAIFFSAFAITRSVQAFATAVGQSQEQALNISTEAMVKR